MKTRIILLSALTGLFSVVCTHTFAQDSLSLQKSEQKALLKEKEQADKQRLEEAVDLKRNAESNAKVAKANAREANRINDDAAVAAREAKQAARLEAKAQRNRNNADKQARKSAKATAKSDSN